MSGSTRFRGIVVVIAAISLAVAAVATAAVGDLSAVGCVEDDDSAVDDCSGAESQGLDGVIDVEVSPDSAFVYSASRSDHAIAIFKRRANGTLLPRGCVDDVTNGPDDCARSTPAMQGLQEIVISPDGTSLYAVGNSEDAIVHFDRNPITGALAPRDCIDDLSTGFDTCSSSTEGLSDANGVAISPDGTSVYVASTSDQAIVTFKRNPGNGALSPRGCIDAADLITPKCPVQAPALNGVSSLAVSPDGTSLYAAGTNNDAVLHFKRNPANGALLARACTEDDDTGLGFCPRTAPGLDSVRSVAVSPDGGSVYAGGRDDDAVAIFARNATNGALGTRGCVEDADSAAGEEICASSAPGLEGAAGLVVSADGESVYVAGAFDDTLVAFDRNAATSRLSAPRCVRDAASSEPCTEVASGLEEPRGLAASPDGSSLFAAAVADDDVVATTRVTP